MLHTCEYLEKNGCEVTYLDVDEYGRISIDELKRAIRQDTILISIMFANNEIGTIEPVKEIGEDGQGARDPFSYGCGTGFCPCADRCG